MNYCPLISYRKEYTSDKECMGEECMFVDATGDCLIKQALQCYVSKERTSATEQESAEHYWMTKKDGTRTPIVFNGESDFSYSDN